MTLVDGAETMGTEDGHAGHRPPIATLEEPDLRHVHYFALFPNALVSLHPDYVMLHTLWPKAPDRTDVDLRVLLRAGGDRGGRLRPLRRDRVLEQGQRRGLARLRTEPEGGGLARATRRAATRPRNTTSTPSTRWSPPATWTALREEVIGMNEIAAQLGEVGLPEPLSRPRRPRVGRDRRRRRPQRPHRGRLPGAGRAQRPRPRAPRAARRRLHPRAPVRRRPLRRQPLRLRRRPARRAGDARARPAPPRPALLRRRPEPLGPVRGRHLVRPVARRLQDPGRPRGDGPLQERHRRLLGLRGALRRRPPQAPHGRPRLLGRRLARAGPRSRRCWAASRR